MHDLKGRVGGHESTTRLQDGPLAAWRLLSSLDCMRWPPFPAAAIPDLDKCQWFQCLRMGNDLSKVGCSMNPNPESGPPFSALGQTGKEGWSTRVCKRDQLPKLANGRHRMVHYDAGWESRPTLLCDGMGKLMRDNSSGEHTTCPSGGGDTTPLWRPIWSTGLREWGRKKVQEPSVRDGTRQNDASVVHQLRRRPARERIVDKMYGERETSPGAGHSASRAELQRRVT